MFWINQVVEMILNNAAPKMWVRTMIDNAGNTRRFRLTHFGPDSGFSTTADTSTSQPALTQVVNPWNIMATLMRMALGMKVPILLKVNGPVRI